MIETTNLTKKRIQEYLSEGKRFDSRKLSEYRKIEVETPVSKNAEGSARVKIGKTEVIAGVKMDVSEPYTDSADAGTLVTGVELTPLSSSRFEHGPPKIDAIEIARIVDRGIRESGFIDFKKLCIKEGEKVWSVFLDIYTINDDGNFIDACALAAVIALKNARMPKYDEKTETVKFGEFTKNKVPVTDNLPITMTLYKIGKNIISDPTREEEGASEGRVSISLSKKGDTFMINAMQKGEEEPFTEEEILHAVKLATENFKNLVANIE